MDTIDICVEIVREKFPNVVGIWLFGSTASETQSTDSDIDLSVLGQQKIDSVALWQCAQQIATRLDKEIDLIDLLEASTVLRAQIIQSGRLIYCGDKFKCDLFETETLTDYLRFADERKEILEDIKIRGRVLGNNG